MASDPFESLFGLEQRYYSEGYELGQADGSRAGRIEGRIFGYEKGFEKFAAMGILHGRAIIWASRIRPTHHSRAEHDGGVRLDLHSNATANQGESSTQSHTLPTLPENSRLEKHVQVLYALAEPASLSTQNSEDAVSDFDDRFKRAQAKAKVIEKIIGEPSIETPTTDSGSNAHAVQDRNVKLKGFTKPGQPMEDFRSDRLQI